MFTVAVGAAVQALLVALTVRGVGSCWIGSTIFAADLVRDELELPADWEPLGAIAIGYPLEPSTATRSGAGRRSAGAQVSVHRVGNRVALRLAAHPTRLKTRCGTPCWRFWMRATTPAAANACRDTSRPRRWCSMSPAAKSLLTLHPRLGAGCNSADTAKTATATSSRPRGARPPRNPASPISASSPNWPPCMSTR